MRKALAAGITAAVFGLPGVAAAQSNQEPPLESKFEKVTLNDRPGEPVSLAVLPDRRVLHTARTGEVRLFNPRTQLNTLAATVDVYQHDEEGLQGIALDPNFSDNHWVYLYYSPPGDTPEDDPSTPIFNEGDAPTESDDPADFAKFKGALRLSRFKFEGGKLKLDTEQKIIDVPVDRGICCHVGGQIAFDPQGNLYLSTGDDSNPFESDSYTPIDERPTRNPAFDAQRSAGNTNDLRGKLLRIRPRANGGYDIPPGNLFPKGTPKTKPEIYLMGLRNPFRFDVNPKNGDVYMADYSPDANEPSADARPGRPRPLDAGAQAGQLRLALLRHARHPVHRLRLRDRRRRARRSTATGRSTTRRTTRASGSSRRSRSRTSGTPTPTTGCSPSCSRTPTATASRRWPARRTSSTRATRRRSSGRSTTTASRCSTSGAGTTSRSSASTSRTAGS